MARSFSTCATVKACAVARLAVAALTVLAQLVTNQATKQPRLVEAVAESLSKEKELPTVDIAFCVERLEEMRIIRYL